MCFKPALSCTYSIPIPPSGDFFFFFGVGVFFKKQGEGLGGGGEEGCRGAGVHILQGVLPEEDSPLGR